MKSFIRKTLSVLLCVLMCASVCFTGVYAETTETTTGSTTETQYDFSYLQNTYAKIMAGETVNIAYLGGSVTNGYAGTDPNGVNQNCQNADDGRDCWREGTFKWFKETFADTGATFVENHAAIGGTGSDLNLYRTENALKLGTADAADLVFIEFGINDSYEKLTQAESAEYMEAIVRQIYESDPYTDVCIIVVTDNGKTNTKYANAAGHEEIALAYDIPILWIGADLYDYIAALEGGVDANWYSYFADGCHPNVYGHAIYTQSIIDRYLVPNLTKEGLNLSTTKRTAKVMPEPVYDGGFWNSYEATVASFYKNFVGYGFGTDGKNIYANVGGGDSFNIRFYGTGFGLRYTASDTNGVIQYNVDGGDYQANDFRNPNSNGGTNHHMLVQGLNEGWHEMNIILRKTVSGSGLTIHSFFIDGDAAKQPFTFGTPPTSAPNTELYIADIVLTPKLLDTTISGTDYINDGSVRTIEVAIIDDVDTLSYVPNTESSEPIASDNYSSTFRNVTIPEYKYVTVGYHYIVPDGVTPSAKRMMMNYLQLTKIGGTVSSYKSYSAQSGHKINESDELIFDITNLPLLGVDGSLQQMHFYPMGYVKGNEVNASEKMHIKNVIFHADYPYDTSPVALDLAEAEVSAATATAETKDESAVTKIVASGKAALSFDGLESLEMFPSVYNYVQVEYYAESGEGTPALYIPTLDNGAYTAAASTAIATGEWRKATFNLSDIAGVNGQTNFYKDAVLYPYGEAESDGTMYIKSIKFYHAYPDPDAEFSIKFDLNGGKGTAPADITAKIGAKVTLPSCSATKEGLMFAGWAKAPDSTEVITKFYMPENGTTLYAVWIETPVVYVSATDTEITYEGVKHTVEYTSLSAALTALGTNGGTVVMTGELAFADLASIPANCLGIELVGADDTAMIAGFNANYTMKAPLKFVDITIVDTVGGGARYFMTKGHKLQFIGNTTFKTRTTNAETGEVAYTKRSPEILAQTGSGDVEYVLAAPNMSFGVVGVVYNSNFNGNGTIVIDGTAAKTITYGCQTWDGGGVYTYSGNINLIINSGSVAGVTFRNYVDGTGAKTLIYNNGMKEKNTALSGFDYTIDASVGGEVSIKTQATATTAPTFLAKAAKSDYEIKCNGESVGFGSYEFTPSATGTYDIDFVIPEYTVTFDANGGEGTAPAAVTDLDETAVDLSAQHTLTKDGFTFIGWATKKDTLLPLEEYIIDGENETLYAVWAPGSAKFVNPDGSGKLKVGVTEYDAVSTLAEAVTALDSNGGVIYFTGTVNNGTSNEVFTTLSKLTKGNKAIFQGVGSNAVLQIENNQVNFKSDVEFRNIIFDRQGKDWFSYSNAHNVVFGEYGVENDIRLADGNFIRHFGGHGGTSSITVNSGIYDDKFSGASYSQNLTGNTLYTINGGTFKRAVNAGFYSFSSTAAFTQTGNSTVVINGGTFEKPSVVWLYCAAVTGKKTVIFNNNMAETMTAPDADYIIDNGVNGYVSELTSGTEFLVTPISNLYIPVVNGVEMTANEDGKYVLAPTENGTYTITYNILPTYAVTFDANGGEGTAPEAERGISGTVLTLPETTGLTKTGYTFCGWSETADHKVILGETYTIGNEAKTLYAVWQKSDIFYVNPDASGKLTMGGAEYIAPYASLNAAAEAIVSSGIKTPTIIFTGETHTKTDDVDFWSKLKNKGISKLILKGTSTDTATLVQYQTQNIYCHTEYRSMSIKGATDDVYTYCNGYEVTVGEKGVENDVVVIQNGKYLQLIGSNGNNRRTIINSGTFSTVCAMYSSNLTGTSYIEINGGTFNSAVNGGFLSFTSGATFTLGNSTVVINGGTHTTSKVIFDKVGTCTGKRTVILNNGMADKITTVTGADYIIKSTTDGFVSEFTSGASFLVTPDADYLVPSVNGTPMTANEDGKYVLTPTESGTYEITYDAVSDVTVEITKISNNPAIIKTTETDGFDYNSSAKISLYTNGDELVTSVLESEITDGGATIEGVKAGSYYIVIEKNGYLTYTSDVFEIANGESIPLEPVELIAGDIKGSYDDLCGDGVVDIDDFIRIVRSFANDATEQLKAVTDIDEDGSVSVADLTQVKANMGKSTGSYKQTEQ